MPVSASQAIPQGGYLRSRRAAVGLSQQRLAELAACSLAMVRLLESGYSPKDSDVVPRIERTLNDHDPGDKSRAAVKIAGGAATHGSG